MRINKKSLVTALNAVAKVSPANPSWKSLKNVLIEHHGNQARFSCTDMNAYMIVETEASGGGVFVSVPVRLLKQVVGLMPDGEIMLDEMPGTLKVSSGNIIYSINTADTVEFPESDKRPRKLVASMACADLKAGLLATTYAVSKDDARPRLEGVCLDFGEETNMVATDGFRMAICKTQAVVQEEKEEVFIPLRCAEALRQLLPTTERVVISSTDRTVEFEFGNTRLQIVIPELKFVLWKQVLPSTEPISSIVVSRTDMLRAAKLAALEDKYLDVSSRGYTVNVSGKTVQVGIPFDNGTPINFDISLNCRYLADTLASMPGDSVSLEFRGDTRPLMIKSMNDKQSVLIMPAHLGKK